jgi:hypothetical protein
MNDDEKSRVAMAQAIKAAFDEWPARLELVAYQAKLARARFQALRKEGFDVGQALQLCTKNVEV